MNRLILVLLFWPCLAQSTVYTLSWNPVPGATWYGICQESSSSYSVTCSNSLYYTYSTSISINIDPNTTTWFRVRASTTKSTGPYIWQSKEIDSQFSNPVEIVDGLTPPIIQCVP